MSKLVRIVMMAIVTGGFAAPPVVHAQQGVGGEDRVSPRRQRPERPEERRRRTNAMLGSGHAARGSGALYASTIDGRSSPQALPAPGDASLAVQRDFDLGGYVFRDGTPFIHDHGGADYFNTALGRDALISLTLGVPDYYFGAHNTGMGFQALRNTTSGRLNTGVGAYALSANTSGYSNTAVGAYAGTSWTTGIDNIAIGSGAYGYAGETGTIRIGGIGRQSATYIEGIRGTTTGMADAITVMIDSYGQLGTMSSSRQVKEDIQDLGALSNRLLDLRPVTFRYKRPFTGGDRPVQFGLVAEEVAEVFPELVVYDERGNPETVKYHWLSVLLVNELQEEKAEIQALRRQVAELRTVVAELRRQPDIAER